MGAFGFTSALAVAALAALSQHRDTPLEPTTARFNPSIPPPDDGAPSLLLQRGEAARRRYTSGSSGLAATTARPAAAVHHPAHPPPLRLCCHAPPASAATTTCTSLPSPSPPPPPSPAPPPAQSPTVIGIEVGLRVNLTGDARVDAHNIALVDALMMIERIWVPIAAAALSVVLFLIHNTVLSSSAVVRGLSQSTRHMINVCATGLCFMLCGFAFLVFNKLVLLSVPLPCLIAAIEMGASCVMLLLVNGAVSAVFHSRTKRLVGMCLHEVSAFSTTCCSCCCPPRGSGDGQEGDEFEDGYTDYTVGYAASDRGGAKKSRTQICNPNHACGLAFCGVRKWVGIKIGSRQDVWRWMPASVLYAGAHLFLIMALRDVTVTALVVWRQLAPIPTMIVERFLTNAVYRATCSSTFGLLLIGLGVIIYSFSDYEFSWLGTLFALLSTFMMVWEGLLKRHLLTDAKQPLVLSLQAMVLLNNVVGCGLALLLVLSYEIWIFGYQTLPSISYDEILYICASVLLSALYHYMGLQLAKAVSATSLLTATNLSKILVVVFGVWALGDTATPLAWAGIILAILGNVIYMLARLHVMNAQALLKETVTHHQAKDIVDNIAAPPGEAEPEHVGDFGASLANWFKSAPAAAVAAFGGGGDGEEGMPGGGAPGGAPPPPSYKDAAMEEGKEPFEKEDSSSSREQLSALRQRVMGGGGGGAPSPVPSSMAVDLDDDGAGVHAQK